jgi:hypothetical protein
MVVGKMEEAQLQLQAEVRRLDVENILLQVISHSIAYMKLREF